MNNIILNLVATKYYGEVSNFMCLIILHYIYTHTASYCMFNETTTYTNYNNAQNIYKFTWFLNVTFATSYIQTEKKAS